MSDEEERPKGILKHNPGEKKTKAFQWDEMNIMATYHPSDKDYGHMKVDEPPTPYNFEYNANQDNGKGVSPEALANMLASASEEPPKMLDEMESETKARQAPEEEEHRRKFEEKRKTHYNEFQAVRRMREHHSQDDEEEGVEAAAADDEDDLGIDPVAARNAKLNANIQAPKDDSP